MTTLVRHYGTRTLYGPKWVFMESWRGRRWVKPWAGWECGDPSTLMVGAGPILVFLKLRPWRTWACRACGERPWDWRHGDPYS